MVSGGAGTQRVMYGTADGVVHLRRLARRRAGRAAPTSGDDADVFGPVDADPGENRASVAFADTSTRTRSASSSSPTTRRAGIEIAHFDAADGSLVQQFAVPRHERHDDRVLAARDARRAAAAAVLRRGRAAVQGAGRERRSAPPPSARRRAPPTSTPPRSQPGAAVRSTCSARRRRTSPIGTTDGFLRTYRARDLTPGPFEDLTFALGPACVRRGRRP